MFSKGFIKIISVIVFITAPVISTITNFMYCIGTGNLGYLNTIYQRDDNNDILNVLSWSLHILSAIIFYFLNAPILNFLYQIFLGTVIQHALWMFHNYHKKKDKPHLFVPFWKLQYYDMWKDISVTIIPISIAIYLV